MKIGIIGGGAIGMLFACHLAENHQVTLYCRTLEQANCINEHGILLNRSGNAYTCKVQAELSETLKPEDLFIITVKQYHLQDIVPVFVKIPADTPVLFLQNGVGHLPLIEQLPHRNVFLGVVEHGALRQDIHEVVHTGIGITRIAVFKSGGMTPEQIYKELHTETFPFSVEKDYTAMLTGKLIVNAVINPLTAILKVKNGELVTNEDYLQMFNMVFEEVTNI